MMRAQVAAWLRQWADWLLPPVVVEDVEDPCMARVRELVVQADGFAIGTSGEYKRHVVYARLIKDYPEARHRDLALLIELAVQGRP